MNRRIYSLLFIALILGACDSSVSTSEEVANSPEQEEVTKKEYINVDPVHIHDKEFNPPPSPVSRLRKKFDGRQKRYTQMINQISKKYRVNPFLTHAIISQESWYRPTVGSPAGAVGLMQLIESAGRRFGCANRKNPKCNVTAGVKYLKFLAEMFEGKGNLQTIASGYNAGEAAAKSYLEGRPLKGKNPKGRKTPNGVPVASFGYSSAQKKKCSGVNQLPGYECEGETYHYARNVAGYYRRYQKNPSIIGLTPKKAKSYSCQARELC